jgi:hypothetical protein
VIKDQVRNLLTDMCTVLTQQSQSSRILFLIVSVDRSFFHPIIRDLIDKTLRIYISFSFPQAYLCIYTSFCWRTMKKQHTREEQEDIEYLCKFFPSRKGAKGINLEPLQKCSR